MKYHVHIFVFVSLLWGATAWAQDVAVTKDDVVETQWAYDRAGWEDVILTGTALSTALVSRVIGPSPNRWQGGILFDEDVRDALRPDDRDLQLAAAGISDVTLALATAMPIIDASVVSYGYYKDPVMARELAILNLDVIAVIAALQTVTNSIASRERPYGRRCGGDLDENLSQCVANDRHYSFFSGHSAQSFGAAALTCSTHARLKLYGGGFADFAPCIMGFVLAGATATARVVADKHYFSDIVVGSSVGTLTGFLLPYLLRYRKPQADRSWSLLPTGRGLSVQGSF